MSDHDATARRAEAVTIVTVTIQVAQPQTGDRTGGLITYRYDDPKADRVHR